jgi:hypothetical protein
VLRYKPRIITGARAVAQDKRRGPEYTDVFNDECAIGFDKEAQINTVARIRAPGKHLTSMTFTTPKVGPYGRWLKRGGNTIFKARTRDNHYLLARQPNYESNLRAAMSKEQARRELDGELVALEGRIWKDVKYQDYDPTDPSNDEYAWPNGNRHDTFTQFDPKRPWWLFCDLGSATGAYCAVQNTEPVYKGRELFRGVVWVAIADYCPDYNADAANAFTRMKEEFGNPAGVVAGADVHTRDRVDGRTVSFFAQQVFSNVRVYACSEKIYDRQLQFNRMSWLVCSAINQRRFTIARDFKSFDEESHRGIREMFDEDQWPPIDERREHDFLPKHKANVVQHTRDALLMGAVEVMKQPRWGYGAD